MNSVCKIARESAGDTTKHKETKRDEMACLAGIYATHREKAGTIQRNITPLPHLSYLLVVYSLYEAGGPSRVEEGRRGWQRGRERCGGLAQRTLKPEWDADVVTVGVRWLIFSCFPLLFPFFFLLPLLLPSFFFFFFFYIKEKNSLSIFAPPSFRPFSSGSAV